ncbi:MAG: helix-turn-helix transcriptional regulator [Pirellulales bacterium]|nr:helix-turn-helix transcriptional regulator [Pirellulales bacterium]
MSNSSFSSGTSPDLPPLPMERAVWQKVTDRLVLSPQQTRIVELILRGLQDKEIASILNLKVPTVRDYLRRIFDRTGTTSRLALVLHIFALAQETSAVKRPHQ